MKNLCALELISHPFWFGRLRVLISLGEVTTRRVSAEETRHLQFKILSFRFCYRTSLENTDNRQN